jgi:GNAT superfamily N-acetyltransferase
MPEMPQSPVNECQSAAEIEPAALIAWPARERVVLDGWVLRFTDGYTHRGNSVATYAFGGRDLENAIDRAEFEYRVRDLPPMFQIAAQVAPAALADALLARGYQVISPTYVRVTSPERVLTRIPDSGDVAVETNVSDDFSRLVFTGARKGVESQERLTALEGDRRERLDILGRVEAPLACVTAFEHGTAVACGMGVNVGGRIGINLMRTDVEHRRKGHAQRVLSAIARWAEAQRAGTLYLGVEMANTPAIALYERAGFEPAYSYRYYAKGRDS